MAIFDGKVANLSQQMVPNGQPSAVMIDRYWGDWIKDRVQKTNNFYKSGIIGSTPQLDQILLQSGRGWSVAVPHVAPVDIGEKPQRLTNHTDIVANPSGGVYPEQEVKVLQAQSWGTSNVDDYITGADQFDNISNQATAYWAAQDERQMINTINIAFLNPDIKNAKELDQSGKDFSAADMTKATAKMGDTNMNALTAIAVNSGTYQYMISQDLIKYIKPSNALSGFMTYNGHRIVVDDSIPLDPKGNTCAYIFGNNAVTYTAVTLPNGVTTQVDNMAQGGIKSITQKRVVISHVNGTDADLATAGNNGITEQNWDVGLDRANVPMYKPVNDIALRDINLVKYDFKIDTDFVTYANTFYTTHHNGFSKDSNSNNSTPSTSGQPNNSTPKSK